VPINKVKATKRYKQRLFTNSGLNGSAIKPNEGGSARESSVVGRLHAVGSLTAHAPVFKSAAFVPGRVESLKHRAAAFGHLRLDCPGVFEVSGLARVAISARCIGFVLLKPSHIIALKFDRSIVIKIRAANQREALTSCTIKFGTFRDFRHDESCQTNSS